MKAVKVAIVAVALTSASAAVAENLVYYGETADGSVKYYDSDTIRRLSGGYITVWTMEDARKDRTVRYRTGRTLWKIDCEGMMLGPMAFANYDTNGRVLDSESTNYPKMIPAIPGSVGYSLVEAVCAR